MFDIGIGTIVKWSAILAIVTSIGFGIRAMNEMRLDQIDSAVNSAKLEWTLKENQAIDARERELREISRKERKIIEADLEVERAKVSDLQRMLLIDHDLDRLLQRKPGLILPRVNKGTENYFKALEEATQ
jgi:5-bromo-4-chloroindolyl phosphate hydrolysis protein